MLVVIQGPRRSGRTTLAKVIVKNWKGPSWHMQTPGTKPDVYNGLVILDGYPEEECKLWMPMYPKRILYLMGDMPFPYDTTGFDPIIPMGNVRHAAEVKARGAQPAKLKQ